MVHVLVLYNHPEDPAAFDRYYFETHVPIAKRLPGLLGYTVSATPVTELGGEPAPHYLIADLTFDSSADVQRALASPEGAETAADVAKFATGGASMYLYESKEV